MQCGMDLKINLEIEKKKILLHVAAPDYTQDHPMR